MPSWISRAHDIFHIELVTLALADYQEPMSNAKALSATYCGQPHQRLIRHSARDRLLERILGILKAQDASSMEMNEDLLMVTIFLSQTATEELKLDTQRDEMYV
jgi:hypothetical protein